MLRGDKSLFREGKVKHRVEMTFFTPFSIQTPLKRLAFQQSCSVAVPTQ